MPKVNTKISYQNATDHIPSTIIFEYLPNLIIKAGFSPRAVLWQSPVASDT